MKAIGRRIRVIEERRLSTLDQGPPVVFLSPDQWSVKDKETYEQLRGEGLTDEYCDFVERMTGNRPGPKTLLVVWRLRKDGPQ